MDQVALAQPAAPSQPTVPMAVAYLLDSDSEGVMRGCFADLGLAGAEVLHGSLDMAMADLVRRGWPRFLVVDVSGIPDPLLEINRLAEVCDPSTEVFVVGQHNDIVLYRDLKAAGVAEYFFKPLVGSLMNGAMVDIVQGTATPRGARSGKLVSVLGVRGGVGATTIAVNTAWHLAEARERRVLLLDLDLKFGDAALQLDARPTHALQEALEHPERTDNLFFERGVANVTPHLGLLAGLEPLHERMSPGEDAVLELLQKLLAQYRYVVVDLPGKIAVACPRLLHMPGVLLLVSDAGLACSRDLVRWRDLIGPNTPDRSTLHVMNRSDAPGALPPEHLRRIIERDPDVTLAFEREIMAAAALGASAAQKCVGLRQAVGEITGQLVGAAAAKPRSSLWTRIFG